MASHPQIDPQLMPGTSSTGPALSSNPQEQYSPQNIYSQSPNPQSGSGGNTGHGGDGDKEGDPHDPKRPRACEACRGLKVRCDPDPNNPDGPCKRCAKANRQCTVTVPSRKRQKKTDSRVAELEKKIDALTQSLQAQNKVPGFAPQASGNGNEHEGTAMQGAQPSYQQVTNGGYGQKATNSGYAPPVSFSSTRTDPRMVGDWSGFAKSPFFDFDMRMKPPAPPMVIAGQKRKHAETRDFSATPDTFSTSVSGPSRQSVDAAGPFDSSYAAAVKLPQTHEYADVIDRGLVTMEMATQMFNCYVERMVVHMPAVIFPAGTTAADIRKSKPVLFLAILAASSSTNFPGLQRTLTKEIMSTYAQRIICNGQKTLEIIQALHVSAIWYWPPEHFEELKFYQLIHIAAVMAIDLGMGKPSKVSKGKAANLWRDKNQLYTDPESIEARRACLTSYYLCCNASMGLRRPNLIRWTNFMADCVDVLERSPDAAPSDKAFCQWVRIQHIAEEVGTQFSMDDPLASVSIADQKVQYALKGFERDLEKWSSQVPVDVQSAALKMTEHVVNLYMHEIAMHSDHKADEFRPSFTEDTARGAPDVPDALTSAHINALSTCLASIDGIFNMFLTFDVETIRCLPVAHFVRVAYAVVILIKMYFVAATPNSEFGKVINKENMKVEQYIDGLVVLFKASAAEEKSRPSAKFLVVLFMLKTWFNRQREGKSLVGESTAMTLPTAAKDPETSAAALKNNNQNSQQGQGQQQGYSPTNTPLQLLSEVATSNSGPSRSGNTSNYPPSNEWQPQQQYDSMNQMANFAGPGMNLDPALGSLGALGYTIGEGLEQAMGFTLGIGDFAYFNDDTFFGSLLDSVGGGATFDGFDGGAF